jgi:hypothetical protein
MKILVETSEHSVDVTVPEGGDSRTAASVEGAFQKLTNRSKKAKDRIDSIVAMLSPTAPGTAKTKFLMLPATPMQAAATGWYFGLGGTMRWTAITNSAILLFPLDVLPPGSTITKLEALVVPGDTTGTMGLEIRRVVEDFDAVTIAQTTPATGVASDGTATLQVLSIDSLSEVVGEDRQLYALVSASNNAGSVNDDCYGIKIHYNDPGYSQPSL